MRDTITELKLDDVERLAPPGGYVRALVAQIRELHRVGLTEISEARCRQMVEALAAEQGRYLLANDGAHGTYREMFGRLGIEPGKKELTPEIILEDLAYPAATLVGGEAQRVRQVSAPLSGGRIFLSSGTTNPSARKRVYYDAVTAVLIREVHRAGWVASARHTIRPGNQLLLMTPPEAKIAMPFAAFVADYLAAQGVQVHWGARFLQAPAIKMDSALGVPTADLVLKDNIAPNPRAVAAFNCVRRLRAGPHIVMGLLPAIGAMIMATSQKRGVARFFAHPEPSLVAYGGGLKGLGVPATVRQAGPPAVAEFLAEVASECGAVAGLLTAMDGAGVTEKESLDNVLNAYWVRRLEEKTGARCLNVFAGAEIQPSMFPAGTLHELYGDRYWVLRSGRAARDIFIPIPGVTVQLRDPVTARIVPKTELGVPGIFRSWNPYNVSHLHAVESDDIFSWTALPQTASFRPAYAGGVGLVFEGRVQGWKGGFCG
jgi:hypothetical protein